MIKFKKVFILFLFLIGLTISGYGIIGILEAQKCRDWKMVKGRVLGAMLTEISDLLNEHKSDNFVPDIAYEYMYEDITYFKQTIGYFPSNAMGLHDSYYAGSEDEIIAFTKKFPVNAEIDVYVNPDNPKESVLETDLKMPVFIPFLFGALLIYMSINLVVFKEKYLSVNKETKET